MSFITAKEAYQITMDSITKGISKRDAKWIDKQIRKTAKKGNYRLRLERALLDYSKDTIETYFKNKGYLCVVDPWHIVIDWED